MTAGHMFAAAVSILRAARALGIIQQGTASVMVAELN